MSLMYSTHHLYLTAEICRQNMDNSHHSLRQQVHWKPIGDMLLLRIFS